ncbi:MAG: ATP-binding protein [Pseudomonadota bacterium]
MAATLHLLCGKIASGKSTLAKALSDAPSTVLISEDAWLAALFKDQLNTGADYLRCAERLRSAMAPHVIELLKAGCSVVLDFPANTVAQRAWMKDLLTQTQAPHTLHHLVADDALCLARLKVRNAGGAHPFVVDEALFRRFTAQFEPPQPEEGFSVREHVQSAL